MKRGSPSDSTMLYFRESPLLFFVLEMGTSCDLSYHVELSGNILGWCHLSCSIARFKVQGLYTIGALLSLTKSEGASIE